MPTRNERIDWFERSVAMVFATVAVLGTVLVILTVSLYLPGFDRGSVPLP
jgi:hypothetical protein